jgi:hypothetical protein
MRDLTDFVLTTMILKSTVFWEVTVYSLVRAYRYFRRTYCYHLQVRKINQKASAPLSETSVNVNQTIRQHNPEHNALQIIICSVKFMKVDR